MSKKKLSGTLLSHASDVTKANQLVKFNKDIPQSKLWSILYTLIAVNNWSIRHPYVAAIALICISAFADPEVLLTSTGNTAKYMCFVPVRLSIWFFGFKGRGVEKGSHASKYQARHYGGSIPRNSTFAKLQARGATMPSTASILVSLWLYIGAVIVLVREWGWWF
ncbi:uncharacterized protein EDB91DRAFT_1178293 [Suillus paluster]|uniref:uncharacterized protein n=1 Tax=Suillus paluster TaxID=48578 RepID=UPI001B874258|nr:uncharacterized protein EDB91DRAFT_1178293 [Suillus paluster]KAG1720271.1 hypothetical protein EDB91DRAFT_1178293 [Suillus paluster]